MRPGTRGAEHNDGYAGGDCYLRMERKRQPNHRFVVDGRHRWKQLKPIDTLWPSQLRVGLSVANSNSEPLTVRFEEFTLTGKIVGR